jgi:hypothetical protein
MRASTKSGLCHRRAQRGGPRRAPVIDGRWNGQNAPTGEGRRPQVLISKRDVTMTGFTIRNVPGAGVAVTGGGDSFTMTDCLIHDCFDSGVAVNGLGHAVENVTFRGVHVRRVSRSWVVEESPKGVAGCFLFRYAKNALVEDSPSPRVMARAWRPGFSPSASPSVG